MIGLKVGSQKPVDKVIKDGYKRRAKIAENHYVIQSVKHALVVDVRYVLLTHSALQSASFILMITRRVWSASQRRKATY